MVMPCMACRAWHVPPLTSRGYCTEHKMSKAMRLADTCYATYDDAGKTTTAHHWIDPIRVRVRARLLITGWSC